MKKVIKSLFTWKPIKVSPLNISKYPKRTKREIRLIDTNPFGDKDRDGVPNIFDCKPLNKKKQGEIVPSIPIQELSKIIPRNTQTWKKVRESPANKDLYHGTNINRLSSIVKKGLLPKSTQKTKYKRGEKVYFSDDPRGAAYWSDMNQLTEAQIHKPVLLKVKQRDIKEELLKEDVAGIADTNFSSLSYPESISPTKIQIYTKKGWQKLAKEESPEVLQTIGGSEYEEGD